jgi:hypothetical protein
MFVTFKLSFDVDVLRFFGLLTDLVLFPKKYESSEAVFLVVCDPSMDKL